MKYLQEGGDFPEVRINSEINQISRHQEKGDLD